MRLRLNLANHPLENNRKFIVGSGVLGGAAFIALLALSIHAYRIWRADSAIRAQISTYQEQIHNGLRQQEALHAFFSQPAQKQKIDRAAYLNSLIEQRTFPWTRVFEDLEKKLPAGVRVVSIAPHLQNGKVQVKLLVGAETDEGKLKFLKALEGSKVFSDIEVRQETHPKQSTGGLTDKVQLELDVLYTAEST
jgi:Tfp pilus assembly protein PilN